MVSTHLYGPSPFPLEKVQGATRIGATGLRASERGICLWEGLWEDLWKPLKNLWSENPLKNLLKPLKTSKNLWKPLKTSKNPPKTSEKTLKISLRDPLRGRFPSQRLSVLLPLSCCPLNSLRFLQDPSRMGTNLRGAKSPKSRAFSERGQLSQAIRRQPDYSSNLCPPKHLLYDFLGGVLGLLPVVFLI